MASREWFGSGYETPESDSYLGLSRAAALDAARASGIKAIRVFDVGSGTYTFDLMRDRLDIEDEIVVAAGFF